MKTLLAILLLTAAAVPAFASGTVPAEKGDEKPKITQAYTDATKAELVSGCKNDLPQAEQGKKMTAPETDAACTCIFNEVQRDKSGTFDENTWRAIAVVMQGKRGQQVMLNEEMSKGLTDMTKTAVFIYPTIYPTFVKDDGIQECIKDKTPTTNNK